MKYRQESVMEICLKETNEWWTGRGIIALTFLVLVMFTSCSSFAGWLWSTSRWWWWWWWAASCPPPLFLLLWWLGSVVWKANYLIVLKVAWQRFPFHGLNLSFSHYCCLPLFVINNRDQFFKILIQSLNFINQSLPRFDKIQNLQIWKAAFSSATRKEKR